MALGTWIALAVSVLAAALLYMLLKKIAPLIYNGLAGIAVFWILDLLEVISVKIDVWTFLMAAIGGVFGVAAVVALATLGVPL